MNKIKMYLATYLTVKEKMDIIMQVLTCFEMANVEMISEDSGFKPKTVKRLLKKCIRTGKPISVTDDGYYYLIIEVQK